MVCPRPLYMMNRNKLIIRISKTLEPSRTQYLISGKSQLLVQLLSSSFSHLAISNMDSRLLLDGLIDGEGLGRLLRKWEWRGKRGGGEKVFGRPDMLVEPVIRGHYVHMHHSSKPGEILSRRLRCIQFDAFICFAVTTGASSTEN